jgi:hypothetical protein
MPSVEELLRHREGVSEVDGVATMLLNKEPYGESKSAGGPSDGRLAWVTCRYPTFDSFCNLFLNSWVVQLTFIISGWPSSPLLFKFRSSSHQSKPFHSLAGPRHYHRWVDYLVIDSLNTTTKLL